MSSSDAQRPPPDVALGGLAALSELMAWLSSADRAIAAIRTALRWLLPTLRATSCVALGVTEVLAVCGVELGPTSVAALRRHGSGQIGRLTVPELGPVELLSTDVGMPPTLRLAVLRPDSDPFTGDDVQLHALCADTVTMALRLIEQGRPAGSRASPDPDRRRDQRLLETVLRAQRMIIRREPLDDVLTGLVVGVRNLMGTDTASLHLIDPEQPDMLQMRALAGPGGALSHLVGRTSIGTGASGLAVREDRTVVLEDYYADGGFTQLLPMGIAGAMATPVYADAGVFGALVVTTLDRTRRFSAEDQRVMRTFADNVSIALIDSRTLERMDHALRDHLTGLPGRALLLERLDHALRAVREHGRPLAVLFCDLDGFKAVNDTLGHAVGDQLLGVVARRLRDSVRAGDMVARLGGDEFAVVLERVEPAEVTTVVERVLSAVRVPAQIGSHHVRVGVSVGVADSGLLDASVDDLLHAADLAMYRSKRAGGDVSTWFVGSLREQQPVPASGDPVGRSGPA